MKNRLWVAAALPAAFVALSGCVYDDYSYGGWSGSYGAVGVGYSSGYPGYYSPGSSSYGYGYSPVYYDAFYDNFYGPIYGGYWHNDGLFYYQSYSGGPWYCDYSRHFRRESFRGGNQYRFEDRRQSGDPRPGSIADKIIRQDNPGWDGNRGDGGRNGGRGQGASQQSFQGNPAPGGNRGGAMTGRNTMIGKIARGGLDGGPGGSSGESPAATPPPPQQQVSPPDSFRGQNRNGRGENDGARFQNRQWDGQADRQQSDRSSGPPRSSPPPSERQNSGSGGWSGGGGGPKSEHRNKGGRN
jgi:hypothetical protein